MGEEAREFHAMCLVTELGFSETLDWIQLTQEPLLKTLCKYYDEMMRQSWFNSLRTAWTCSPWELR